MQTTIIYNGILIKDILTESIVADAVKEGTGVDQLGVRYVVTGTGIIHMAAQDHTGLKVSKIQFGLYPVLQALTKDRRPFVMSIGGIPFISVKPGAAEPNAPANTTTVILDSMDLENGPIPKIVVTKITAGVSAHIQFSFSFTIPNCGGPGGTRAGDGNGLISLRFWIAEAVDCTTWLTTRTYHGRIRVSHKNISPHELARRVTIPRLYAGFIRRIMRWDESENGLELSFAIEDQEMVAAPPYNKFTKQGATAWSGRLLHSTDTLGATSIIDATVRLTGPKSSSILDLADIAIRVISQKIQYVKLVQGKKAFFLDFSILEQLAENTVECACRIRHTGEQRDFIGLFNLGSSPVIGQPMGNLGIGYDSEVALLPKPTASTFGLFRSLLQTPCQPAKMPMVSNVRSTVSDSQSTQSGGEFTEPSASFDSAASNSQLEAMYFDYRMDSDYHLHTGRLALATGSPFGSQDPTIAVVSLHRPTSIREIRIEASRLNFPPELPAPNVTFGDLNGIKNTPIGEIDMCPSAPQLSADARNFLFETKFTAWYAMDRPPQRGQKVAVGVVPYRKTSGSDATRSLPPSIFLPPESLLT